MKRHLNMNEFFLSPSIHHRKPPHLIQQVPLNQNRSISPIKSTYSSSYTNLSEKDFHELRHALQTIYHYTQSEILCDHNQLLKQRLTSPYLHQRLHKDDQSSLPLYTNEYFIRNGLLNHNDGPTIHDNHSKPVIHLRSYLSSSSSMILTSPMNISLPLTLLSNQKYLFSALTSNFTLEKFRRSQSNMELSINETESMIVRRNKVQTWKKENILQQRTSVQYAKQLDISEYHQSSSVQTLSTSKDDIEENSSSIHTCNKEEGNEKPSEMKTNEDLFPMVKVLAPYIIIRDSFQLKSNNNRSNSILTKNIDSQSQERTLQYLNRSEKRSVTDVVHPILPTAKRRSPSLSTVDQTLQANNDEEVYREKKNYLLAEFESVLTEISKKHFR